MSGVSALLALFALAAPAPEPERSYTIVTGAALRDALVGKLVEVVPCYSSDQCTVAFGRDGRTYYRHGDRVPWQRGTYAIHVDQACAVVPPGPETCHLLFRSAQGSYAIVRADDPSLRPEAVRIIDAEGVGLPD